jgi:alpha-glucosidase
VRDPFEKNVPGMGLGRDPERTPMQWDSGPNAGFSSAEPWLPVAADGGVVNVARQREDPRSMLTLCRRLIELRRREPALSVGGFQSLKNCGGNDCVIAYVRRTGADDRPGRRFLIVLNLGSEPQRFDPPGGGRVVLSTQLDREGEAVKEVLALRGDEGVVVELAD